jgi:hypothetical protein
VHKNEDEGKKIRKKKIRKKKINNEPVKAGRND